MSLTGLLADGSDKRKKNPASTKMAASTQSGTRHGKFSNREKSAAGKS